MPIEIYSKTYRLDFTQCYPNGFLKYSELSNLMQLVAAEHAAGLGFDYMNMAKQNQAWVLTRVRIEIDKLPKLLQEITIHTWIEDFLGNRSVRDFAIEVGGKKIIGASTFWAVLNIKERKSENLAIHINPQHVLSGKKSTSVPFRRIDQQTDYDQHSSYTVRLSDLDVVQHVNNVRYTEWCMDSLDAAVVLNKPFKSIDMNYIKELGLGQEVNIAHSLKGDEIHFSISKGDKTIFLMDIHV
ncbi:acyl-[acyl-carrier-protein] thioesterase [Sphingobacterium wenxiniae]|uniref:Acyl-ACP thioesterase n=1 Tax=Sphingobacterium wenxiniae TaxID=683125 RepID=A0A1I6PD53_9SPHI|nr:acyl-ACP thioesterase domain-containing protein [Sphingobacterium wenxiniae]SFS38093.1 Acyl-ACP thioesterase [Sphingobacterium wenxiniae]